MRRMLQICDAYAAHYSVIFNAQKSKCLCCRPTGTAKQVSYYTHYPSFYIGSQAIEFVDKWPHLGHLISNCYDDMDDILSKKSSLIGQVNKILCNFRNGNCSTKTRLVKAYTAQVSMELKYGICLIAVLNLYAQPGAKE